MSKHILAVVAGVVFSASSVSLVAQGGAAGTAVTAAARTAAPTGPVSAVTKAATAVRSMRAAAQASRGAGTAASAGASRASAVTGYLWTANNSPISNATVQLRNTVTGQVEMYTKTNAVGEFLFSDMKGGSYVIEYVSSASETAVASAAGNSGSVIAVGSPFSVAPGETVATFVRSINNVPMFLPDLATNVAQSAVQSAANAGVTAVVTPLAESAPPAVSVVISQ